MSMFGQVWLWSILAFFIGVLLTSLFVVLPLRKKYRGLESELARVHAHAAPEPKRTFEPEPVVAPAVDEYAEAYDAEYRTVPGVAPEPEPAAQPEESGDPYRAAATQYLSPVGTTTAADEDPYRAVTSEFLRPEETAEPPGSLFSPVGDPTEYTEPVRPPAEPAVPALSQLEQRLDADPPSLFSPPSEPHAPDPDWFDHEPPAERSAFEEPMARTRYLG